jgi:hypothetical protein
VAQVELAQGDFRRDVADGTDQETGGGAEKIVLAGLGEKQQGYFIGKVFEDRLELCLELLHDRTFRKGFFLWFFQNFSSPSIHGKPSCWFDFAYLK